MSWSINQQIIQIDPELVESIFNPENGNYRIKDGKMQWFNTDTGLWHSEWVEMENGVPVKKLADVGEE